MTGDQWTGFAPLLLLAVAVLCALARETDRAALEARMKRTLLFLALAGIGSAQQFGGGIMGPAVERDAGRPTRKVRPATAIDFAGAEHIAPAGSASRLARPANAGWWKRHLDTALHLGATSADAASSWGRVELNPVLRSSDGRFGARGLAIKGTFAIGVEIIKWRLAKRHPRERWVRALSLVPAAAFGTVSARNWRLR